MVGQLIMLAQEGGGAEGCGDGSGDGQADQVIGAGGGIGLLGRFLLFGGADDDDGAGVIGGGRDDLAGTRISRDSNLYRFACGSVICLLHPNIILTGRNICAVIGTGSPISLKTGSVLHLGSGTGDFAISILGSGGYPNQTGRSSGDIRSGIATRLGNTANTNTIYKDMIS